MDTSNAMPPGEDPNDPANKDIDPVAFALDRVQTYLHWIEEHRAHFEAARASDPDTAERELSNLAHSTQEARLHMARLVSLVLAGYTIDPSKRLPLGLEKLAKRNAVRDPSHDTGCASAEPHGKTG